METEEQKDVAEATAEVKVKAPRAPRAKKAPAAAKEPKEKAPRATKTAAAASSDEVVTEKAAPKGEYIFAIGRRKTAIARVRMYKTGTGKITVNDRDMEAYFPVPELQAMFKAVLVAVGLEGAIDIVAHTQGGGIHGQADSVRLGLSRALIILNPTYRKTLKKMGCLTRDPRAKERKKFGLRKARRAPQWSKR